MIPPRFPRVFLLRVLCAMPTMGRGEQFVLFDVTSTYTQEDADNSKPSKSHNYVTGTS